MRMSYLAGITNSSIPVIQVIKVVLKKILVVGEVTLFSLDDRTTPTSKRLKKLKINVHCPCTLRKPTFKLRMKLKLIHICGWTCTQKSDLRIMP